MSDAPSMAVVLALAVAGLTSLVVLFRLFQKHIDGQPLLRYEPRRPVPWNALAPLVMLTPLALALSAALEGPVVDTEGVLRASVPGLLPGAAAAPPAAWYAGATLNAAGIDLVEQLRAAEELAGPMWMQTGLTVSVALVSYAVLGLAFRAGPLDLGLPTSWRELRQDAAIGATAFAASLLPIYSILFILNALLEPTSGHPLVETLLVHHSPEIMLAAAAAAVISAPLYEEIAFRLVFQGWLERCEALARRRPRTDSTGELAPPADNLRAAPPGWTPLVVSSVVFGVAHYGHGVSPAPLILLGCVLGYLYRQTHRIVPSIVCHMLFNGLTIFFLALQFA
jgi:membrane protease YdiL (CAAX protease family)